MNTFFLVKWPTLYFYAVLFFCFIPVTVATEIPVYELKQVLIQPPVLLSDFQLVDQNEQVFDKKRLENKWTFLFFGYTHCPDVCPMTLTEMNDMFQTLSITPEYQADTQLVFVSVDPFQDNPKELKEYLDYFTSPIIGAVAPVELLEVLTRQLNANHRRLIVQDSETREKKYVVEHDASIYLIDPETSVRIRFPPPHDSSQLARIYIQFRDQ